MYTMCELYQHPMHIFSHSQLFISFYQNRCIVFLFLVTFSVMCYNVLCDKYCTRQIYGYCPSWALDWEYRKTAILKEILHYEADILGLQVMCKQSCCRNWFVYLFFYQLLPNTFYISSINWTKHKHQENIDPFNERVFAKVTP